MLISVFVRNQGSGAPFATANDDGPVQQHSGRDASMQQTVGDDYITPQQRQANVSHNL